MHTNFSTKKMREAGGMDAIIAGIEAISQYIPEHLQAYGSGYEMRLTGHHETCRYDEFKYGVSDRTASIRIPANVAADGCGYLEDRRPNANADPYEVATVLLKSVCGLHS
jgi:glutamine synthetase